MARLAWSARVTTWRLRPGRLPGIYPLSSFVNKSIRLPGHPCQHQNNVRVPRAEHPCQHQNNVRVPRAEHPCQQSIHAQTIITFGFLKNPCQNHNNVRVPKAYGYRSIHAQTINNVRVPKHTVTRASMPKP